MAAAGADMAHAELDATTITSSSSSSPQTTSFISSYSPPSAAAILASASTQQIQQSLQSSAQSARSCGGSNVAIALQQRRKTVYFTVGQRQEVAIFEDYTPSEDIKSKMSKQS